VEALCTIAAGVLGAPVAELPAASGVQPAGVAGLASTPASARYESSARPDTAAAAVVAS
jgi:hypothetical protein